MYNSKIPVRVSEMKMLTKWPLGRQMTRCRDCMMEDTGKRSVKNGHRYKRSTYGRTEKNGEGFSITETSWTPM
jgi:hypothetical protein